MANVSNFSAVTPGAAVSGTLTDNQVVAPAAPTGLRADGPRVTFHFAGAWDAGNTYVYYDVVKDNSGASWICKYPQVPAGTPLEEGDYWTRWADPNLEVEELRQTVDSYVVSTDKLNEQMAGMQNSGLLDKINDLSVFVTPEMFGAKGDGVSDDTTAIIEAFKHENVLAFGIYRIVNTDQNMLVSNKLKHLIGGTFNISGNAKMSPIDNCHVIFNLTDAKIENAKFNSIDASDKNFVFYECKNLIIEQCEFIAQTGWNCCLWNCDNATVENCVVTSQSTNLYNDALHVTGNNIKLLNNICTSNGDDGIAVGYNPESPSGMYPINSSVSSNILIRGNISYGKSRAISAFCFKTSTINDIIISDNIVTSFIQVGYGTDEEPADMIRIKNVTVSNNQSFSTNANAAIILGATNNALINGNVIKMINANIGVLLRDNVVNATISNNVCEGTSANGVLMIALQDIYNLKQMENITVIGNVNNSTHDFMSVQASMNNLVVSNNISKNKGLNFPNTKSNGCGLIFTNNVIYGQYALENIYNIFVPTRPKNYAIAFNVYKNELADYNTQITFDNNIKMHDAS